MNRQTAEVEVRARRKKLAIVGFATNTLGLVPWTDPEFELWGMNQGYMHCLRRCDRWFEMHLPEATPDVRDPNYMNFLTKGEITWPMVVTPVGPNIPERVQRLDPPLPMYMLKAYPEYPTAIRYPIERIIEFCGRDYFTSSVPYMLLLGAMEGFEEIHLYGINLAIGEEWSFERPCAEYWLGWCEGRGIKIYIPAASSLLKQYARYGYAIDARPNASLKNLLTMKTGGIRAQIEQQQAALHQSIGALRANEELMQIAEGVDHGADIVLLPAQQELPKELPK